VADSRDDEQLRLQRLRRERDAYVLPASESDAARRARAWRTPARLGIGSCVASPSNQKIAELLRAGDRLRVVLHDDEPHAALAVLARDLLSARPKPQRMAVAS
jgi:hypothetical protein